MSDRHEQARAEAERQFPDGTWIAREQDRIIFTKGWHEADANPKPTTITREEAERMWMEQEDFDDFRSGLEDLGIAVGDR